MTCGKPLAQLQNQYLAHLRQEKEITDQDVVQVSRQKFLEKLGLKRYCCKSIMTTSVNMMDKI